MVRAAGEPMVLELREDLPGPGEVLVEVAGCGVCHTDLAFYYDSVPTRHPLPLTLGHEISGTVVAAGPGAEEWHGAAVVVPAVIPCEQCAACTAGRGQICRDQIFPGNDVHGGFGSHVRVPAHGLCAVPDLDDASVNGAGLALEDLSVIADAVSTPYQAVLKAGLRAGDLAVFVGVGGVGGFGVQIASARGAHVVGIDVDPERLETIERYGAELTLRPGEYERKDLKRAVRTFARERNVPSWRWRIFETSGTTNGQEVAFGLLGHGSYLSVVGYAPERASLRLSNLMALDATAEGNWGCLPRLYPEVVELVLSGSVALLPFVEHRPLASINETFRALHDGEIRQRVILVPGNGVIT
ncbi:MAG: 6-hydroxycyclohex-1-ene-1-carbonyl-CoA dehydrogenase [Planctomycetes bacterium]|nr:6-hydroxycyclohex-1-ene-1-carbonyl-CoA dehydrogenase [Planctomycetota bacterium]